ncbi:TRADD-N-associated membrane domain-containing protein [Streptomyces sp. 1331.2]|uniref:TRADD-N-associated membrane domain-containing protein n=1 Tax=Streptomyces sp. 1331.2 TaxID=1938835 RepID=UPI00117D986A|nr:hypothetical protein [Streptomyces sp. 1331.2]
MTVREGVDGDVGLAQLSGASSEEVAPDKVGHLGGRDQPVAEEHQARLAPGRDAKPAVGGYWTRPRSVPPWWIFPLLGASCLVPLLFARQTESSTAKLILVGLGSTLVVVYVTSMFVLVVGQSLRRSAAETRSRLEAADSPRIQVHGSGATLYFQGTAPDQQGELQFDGRVGHRHRDYRDPAQDALLVENYALGITQARFSFLVSIAFAAIGSLILLGGVALAIWHAQGDGQRYAAIVASTAGTVTDLTAAMFFVQSNRARRDMAIQGAQMRVDHQEARDITVAMEVLDGLEDSMKAAEVRGELVLRLITRRSIPQEPSEP